MPGPLHISARSGISVDFFTLWGSYYSLFPRLLQPVPLNNAGKVSAIGTLATRMKYGSLFIITGLVMTGLTHNHSGE
jgi:hypothetical protein